MVEMLDSISDAVALSRIQFGATALYHFIFVPLTLGLSTLIAIMETIYVRTGNKEWREAAKFWGLLFGINFAMGVATGIPLEFQFGTNWPKYSVQVGDIFGAPLAIEGLMAFFLEATFIGLWFFGWDKLTKRQHCVVGWLMALGATFSAIWILIANGFMQHPAGAMLNPLVNRIEMVDFIDLVLNKDAQIKFAHTITAGYVCGAVFIIAVSAMYLLKGRNKGFAIRSMSVASVFGFIMISSTMWFGHAGGNVVNEYQPAKMAALEGVCKTEEHRSGFSVIASVSEDYKKGGACEVKHFIKIPYVLGLITSTTYDNEGKVFSVEELQMVNEERIKSGIIAVQTRDALGTQFEELKSKYSSGDDSVLPAIEALEDEHELFIANVKEAGKIDTATLMHAIYKQDPEAIAKITAHQAKLVEGLTTPEYITWAEHYTNHGYGLLLTKYIVQSDIAGATPAMITQASHDTIPTITPTYWAFHIMIYAGGAMILFLFASFVLTLRGKLTSCRKYLWVAALMLPMPWIAIEAGWFLAEYGRQPWAIQDMLPTFAAASDNEPYEVWLSLAMFVILYSSLLVIELYLMIKYIKLGPEGTKLDEVVATTFNKNTDKE